MKTAKAIGEIRKSPAGKTDIKLYSSSSGGHNWPTVAAFVYSATDTIWDFIKIHSLAITNPFADIINQYLKYK